MTLKALLIDADCFFTVSWQPNLHALKSPPVTMTFKAVKPRVLWNACFAIHWKENRFNIRLMETLTFNLHQQGTDEPVLLQVSVQECGVLIREEQDPTVFQSGHTRRQHRASERLYGGWTCHSSRRRGLLSTGRERPRSHSHSALLTVVSCYTHVILISSSLPAFLHVIMLHVMW